MNFLNTINQLSYAKILSITIFLAILIAVPFGVILVRQQTRIKSRAAYDKPIVVDSQLGAKGSIPNQPPKIGRAFPWVGKVGDVIWIQGWNFGNNPTTKELKIGTVVVPETAIEIWTDSLIQTSIPQGAVQGGTVDVTVGNHPIAKSLPLVIYNESTKVKLRGEKPIIVNPKEDNPWNMPTVIVAEKGQEISKAMVWTGDDEIPTEQHVLDVTSNSLGKAMIFDSKGLPILSILLIDSKGNLLPYYVNPIEFDF